MFLGASFNLKYLQRLARESRMALQMPANSASPMLNLCWTRRSIMESLPVSSSCLHCPFTFRPVSVLPAISSSVKITFANSVPKCTGPVIRGFISIAWILASVAAETWCAPFTSARGGLELLGRHGPLEAVLCGSCLLDCRVASRQSSRR